MPSLASIDRMETLECVERNGVIRSLTRLARVIGLTDTSYTALWTGLSQAGIPAAFSPLVSGNNATDQNFSALVLAERSAKVVEMDKVVDVTLKYDHVLDGPYQNLTNPTGLFFPGTIFTKGRSSVVQKPTNFYYPYGNVALGRQQIKVSHTFSLDDRDNPGKNLLQGGEVTLPFPQSNVRIEGYAYVANPWIYKKQIHRMLNSDTWMGEAPRTWLCSEVQFEVLNPSPSTVPVGIVAGTPLYRFEFEMQHDPDTFDPYVVYKDQRTGLPPADVRPATVFTQFGPGPWPPGIEVLDTSVNPFFGSFEPAGAWTVPALGQTSFTAFFLALFEG